MTKITDPLTPTAALGCRGGADRVGPRFGLLTAVFVVGIAGMVSGCKPFAPDEPAPVLVADPSVLDVPAPQPRRSARRAPPITEPPMPPGLPELRAPALAAVPLFGAVTELESPGASVPPSPNVEDPASPAEVASTTGARDIVGFSEEEVAGLLGTPSHVHEEPPATIWRYSKEGCQLDLYLYMDMTTESFRVLTYEMLGTDDTGAGVDGCRDGFPLLAGSR